MKQTLILAICIATTLASCVGKKKYLEIQTIRDDFKGKYESCNEEKIKLEREVSLKITELDSERSRCANLEKEIEYHKNTNKNLLGMMEDLSVISKTGAESIKKSLEAINDQNLYIKDLTSSIARKDSLNLALVMNLKRSLTDVDDEDVTVEVKKGVVYISLSDKMLYSSGSANIKAEAKNVLGKIAKVVNDHEELDILVEGHTDNVPIANDCNKDNWDLSVRRATSVVRMLQTDFAVDPARMTAGGRSEFVPKADNATAEGKSLNRRTEIIILPKLDQFFQLLEPPTQE